MLARAAVPYNKPSVESHARLRTILLVAAGIALVLLIVGLIVATWLPIWFAR